jgi:Predicted transcriptional regulators
MQQRLIEQITDYLAGLSEDERVGAINAFRKQLHVHSPFRSQPIDCVLWIKQSHIQENDYNPNNVAPPEKRLLLKSLQTDGFTQPVVTIKQDDGQYEIVDGFHRRELARREAVLQPALQGYLPVTVLGASARERSLQMASTIRHNRARGRHLINEMSEIVRELTRQGWSDVKIGQELGMDADEILRLRQINGLLDLFGDRQLSQAWTVK